MISLHKAVKTKSQVCKCATVQDAVVATAFPEATEVAVEILAQGGNAVDAAVAAAWALSVCEPSGSGIGGQTTLMIYRASGETTLLDGHSCAPEAVSLKCVSAKQQQVGFRACTVPSTVATLEKTRTRFGRLSLDSVLEPAIRLAKDGFKVTRLQRQQAQWCLGNPGLQNKRPRILRKSRWLTGANARFTQPRLARTLQRLAKDGAQDFYHGALAYDIATDMRKNGGLLTAADLISARLPVTRQPVSIRYRGYEIVSTPPPGGGLQLLLALKVLEKLLPPEPNIEMSDWYEAVALAVFAAFDEREKFPIHPDDFTTSVKEWVLSKARTDEIACKFALQRRLASLEETEEEPGETTHLCVADQEGNVVSLTQSIQSLFGANVANWKLGFLYNNYLITCPRYRHPYQLGSNCLPRSNAAPTLVFKDGKVVLAVGAAGSRRIISSILQIISRVVDLDMSISEALAAPRVHALLNSKIWLEKPAASGRTYGKLSKLFSKVVVQSRNSFAMGGAQAISLPTDTSGSKCAAADPRRDGSAGGL